MEEHRDDQEWDDYETFQEYQEHGRVLSSEERAVEREKERHDEQD